MYKAIIMKKFPQFYLITGEDPNKHSEFLERLERLVSGDMKLIQLRAKKLMTENYKVLAQECMKICRKHQAKLILNTEIEVACLLDADGLHLNGVQLSQCRTRPIPKSKILSAACHDEFQLQQAKQIGVDIVTLSPVQETNSHPGEPSLGWDRFSDLTKQVSMPIFALGGLNASHLSKVIRHGGYGIAAISAFWLQS